MTFTEQLKKENKTLWQINEFILDVERMGYGEVEITIKSHDYKAKIIGMKAVKPKKKTIRKSIGKKIMVE